MVTGEVSNFLLSLLLIDGRGPEILQVVSEELLPVGADEVVPKVIVKVDGKQPHPQREQEAQPVERSDSG